MYYNFILKTFYYLKQTNLSPPSVYRCEHCGRWPTPDVLATQLTTTRHSISFVIRLSTNANCVGTVNVFSTDDRICGPTMLRRPSRNNARDEIHRNITYIKNRQSWFRRMFRHHIVRRSMFDERRDIVCRWDDDRRNSQQFRTEIDRPTTHSSPFRWCFLSHISADDYTTYIPTAYAIEYHTRSRLHTMIVGVHRSISSIECGDVIRIRRFDASNVSISIGTSSTSKSKWRCAIATPIDDS